MSLLNNIEKLKIDRNNNHILSLICEDSFFYNLLRIENKTI